MTPGSGIEFFCSSSRSGPSVYSWMAPSSRPSKRFRVTTGSRIGLAISGESDITFNPNDSTTRTPVDKLKKVTCARPLPQPLAKHSPRKTLHRRHAQVRSNAAGIHRHTTTTALLQHANLVPIEGLHRRAVPFAVPDERLALQVVLEDHVRVERFTVAVRAWDQHRLAAVERTVARTSAAGGGRRQRTPRLTFADGSRVYGDGCLLLPLSPVLSAFSSSPIVPGMTSACVDSNLQVGGKFVTVNTGGPPTPARNSLLQLGDVLPFAACQQKQADAQHDQQQGGHARHHEQARVLADQRYHVSVAVLRRRTCSISSCDISFMSSAAVVASTGSPPTNTDTTTTTISSSSSSASCSRFLAPQAIVFPASVIHRQSILLPQVGGIVYQNPHFPSTGRVCILVVIAPNHRPVGTASFTTTTTTITIAVQHAETITSIYTLSQFALERGIVLPAVQSADHGHQPEPTVRGRNAVDRGLPVVVLVRWQLVGTVGRWRAVEDAQIVVPVRATVAIDVHRGHDRGRLDDGILADWKAFERIQNGCRPIARTGPEEIPDVLIGGLEIVTDDVAVCGDEPRAVAITVIRRTWQ
uniref:Uncharacterized protein n=1 Tax=Anopheles farauti TaxID=69004 RepID=A0A182QVS9_9DIPT